MKKFLKKNKWYIFFWSFCIIVYLLFNFVFWWGNVESSSMYPTYEINQIVFGTRIIDATELQVGDVIAFEHEDQSGKMKVFIKRIAAISGDTVQIGETEVTLKDGEFYMLGDNPKSSWDSRYWEEPFIHAEDIKGKVTYPSSEKANE